MTTWVLLRGWAREARHWGGFPDALQQALPAGDRVLAIDLPGNGARHAQKSPTRVADAVQAVRRELQQQGDTGPYAVVALSLGGMVSLQWAALHPTELSACVLINSSARGLAPLWRRLRPSSYPALLAILRPGLASAGREARILALTSNVRQGDRALAVAWGRYADEHPVSRRNAMRQLLAAARFRLPQSRPAVPMLVLASARDGLVSPSCSRALALRWGLPLHVHPEAGHDLPLDDPQWVIRQILEWQEKTRSSCKDRATGTAGFP